MKRRQPFKWYLYAMGIAFCLMNVMMIFDTFINDDIALIVPVKNNNYINKIVDNLVKNYETVSVYQNNIVIKITNPSIWQRIFWPDIDGQDVIIQVWCIIITICYLWILILIKNHYQPFLTNLSAPLSIAALTTVVIAFYCSFRKHFMDSAILKLTNNEFGYQKHGHHDYSYLFWIGISLFIILSWYEKGYKLQQEQDLTI